MISVENNQIIYLKRRRVETTEEKANYWNKPYNPASYYADLNTGYGNIRLSSWGCAYRKAGKINQKKVYLPDLITLSVNRGLGSNGTENPVKVFCSIAP